MQGKVENGNVYSPVLTGNVFSDTGFYSTATGKYNIKLTINIEWVDLI